MDDCLMAIKTDAVAVAVSREHAKNTPLPISDEDMCCFAKTENIFTYSVVMLVPRDYHLLSQINDLIRRISESGLLSKWQKESEIIRTTTSAATAADGTMKLRIGHVQGAFLLGFLGAVIATAAFAVEWITYWLAGRTNKKSFWKKLESFLCFN